MNKIVSFHLLLRQKTDSKHWLLVVNVCVGGTELIFLLCLQINGTNLPAGGDQEGCLLPAADITI